MLKYYILFAIVISIALYYWFSKTSKRQLRFTEERLNSIIVGDMMGSFILNNCEECQDLCMRNSDCIAYIFDSNKKVCQLFSSGEFQDQDGFIAGKKL